MLDRDEDLARVMMKLGNLYRYDGDPESAIELDEAAAYLLAADDTSPLYVAARFNYTLDLAEAGHYETARDALTALLLLRDAAAGQQVTAEAIRRVASFLRRASQDPAVRFEPSPGQAPDPGAAPAR